MALFVTVNWPLRTTGASDTFDQFAGRFRFVLASSAKVTPLDGHDTRTLFAASAMCNIGWGKTSNAPMSLPSPGLALGMAGSATGRGGRRRSVNRPLLRR